ncbi:hypothetical protein FOZ60_013993 [Perkinsus olseni]|uniref:SPX domain-containing protein n=2 Tax=Perkinsus olseni TaxID=32597 RepID=A0A7J6N8A6_PEROL|nr:hypothetical protein FOZ60_013993 [Perkinsus olseni]
MRFSKRLALAMQEGTLPYLSQKTIKHHLVGLEKLAKTFAKQNELLGTESMASLIIFVNTERARYGIPQRDVLLTLEEIRYQDGEMFSVVDRDIECIKGAIEELEVTLMHEITQWISNANHGGLLLAERQVECAPQKNGQKLAQALVSYHVKSLGTEAACSWVESYVRSYSTFHEHLTKLMDYVDVNLAGFRKLLKRHDKNIPKIFHARDTPFLGFHSIVTRVTMKVFVVAVKIHTLLRECLDEIDRQAQSSSPSSEVEALRSLLGPVPSLGAETATVAHLHFPNLFEPVDDAQDAQQQPHYELRVCSAETLQLPTLDGSSGN